MCSDGYVMANLVRWSFSPEDGSRLKIAVVWVVISCGMIYKYCVSDEPAAFIIRIEKGFSYPKYEGNGFF
jgi:hypothetical protein